MRAPSADLTKPSFTLHWVFGAFVGGLLLFAVLGGAQWIYNLIRGQAAQTANRLTPASVDVITGGHNRGYFLS